MRQAAVTTSCQGSETCVTSTHLFMDEWMTGCSGSRFRQLSGLKGVVRCEEEASPPSPCPFPSLCDLRNHRPAGSHDPFVPAHWARWHCMWVGGSCSRGRSTVHLVPKRSEDLLAFQRLRILELRKGGQDRLLGARDSDSNSWRGFHQRHSREHEDDLH